MPGSGLPSNTRLRSCRSDHARAHWARMWGATSGFWTRPNSVCCIAPVATGPEIFLSGEEICRRRHLALLGVAHSRFRIMHGSDSAHNGSVGWQNLSRSLFDTFDRFDAHTQIRGGGHSSLAISIQNRRVTTFDTTHRFRERMDIPKCLQHWRTQ